MPKQIIIIRHGEKTSDKSFYGLSQKGLMRSLYLADYFNNPIEHDDKPVFNKPDLIYCFNKHKCINRSKQSMQPLIDSGIPYNCNFDNDEKQTSLLVYDMFNKEHDDRTVLICWEHKIIPSLIQQIGTMISDKPIFKKFKSWSINPTTGKNDKELYSMTVVINIEDMSLKCVNQSTTFNKHITKLKKLDKYEVGFSL